MSIQDWFPLGWTGLISLQSKGLSRVFSNTTLQKHQFFGAQLSFTGQFSHPYMTTGKTIALTRWTYVGKVMSLLFNMLSRLSIAFLPRSKVKVKSLSHVLLFATPWIAAHQASLSITNSWSSLRLTSVESVMPSSHLILCRPLFLLSPIPPTIRVFSNESTLHMRWPEYWSFSFSIIPSKEIPGLITFRWTRWISLQSKGLSRVFSNTTVQKHQFFGAQPSSTLTSIHDHRKNHSLD